MVLMPKILNAKTVHDYNAYVGHADQHPLVSVIDYAALLPIRHSRPVSPSMPSFCAMIAWRI